jgi:hypothetical protein
MCYGHLVRFGAFSPFWHTVPRKIWQPRCLVERLIGSRVIKLVTIKARARTETMRVISIFTTISINFLKRAWSSFPCEIQFHFIPDINRERPTCRKSEQSLGLIGPLLGIRSLLQSSAIGLFSGDPL